VLIMLATMGLAVALGRSAPPAEGVRPPSRTEVVIGYDLYGPPTVGRLVVDWRFDLIFRHPRAGRAAAYLLGVRKLTRRGDSWPVGRTASWLAGCASCCWPRLQVSAGTRRRCSACTWPSTMMLAMVAPILLVLAARSPWPCARCPRVAGTVTRAEGWLLAGMHSAPARWLSHPLVALALFVGTYYVLYFSGLFDAKCCPRTGAPVDDHALVITGLLFFWLVLGIDPGPSRLAPVTRLALVFASVPFHAFFGVILMGSHQDRRGYYSARAALGAGPTCRPAAREGMAWATGECRC